jgi:Holliday junction resolvasome RuvABC endonuclease subunit
MLRNIPQALGEVCLSIDVGSQKAGVCLFDAAAQRILYMRTHKLLAIHESFVTSTADVKEHLDELTALIETLLQGREYWVLVEQQYMDADAKAGLYFNIQLQMLIEMYFLQKGRAVKTIHATKRYPFLGIHTWKTDTRAARKNKVVKVVSRLLDPTDFQHNTFATRQHNLVNWNHALTKSPADRRDMADALVQALCHYYRHLSDVLDGHVHATRNVAAVTPSPQPHPCKRSKSTNPSTQLSVSPRTVLRANLQKTLAKLQTKYRAQLRGLGSDAERLLAVHAKDQNDENLARFMLALNRFNAQGTAPSTATETPLANRLAYLAHQ